MLYTATRRLAPLPVSAQPRGQLFETRDARFYKGQEERQRDAASRSHKQASFHGFSSLLGWAWGISPPRCRQSRSPTGI